MASKRFSRRSRGETPAAAAGDVPTIAGYTDLTVIGRGATATVYRAAQAEFGRTVAVKVLHVDMSHRRSQRRFAREKEINGRLSNHPNVVTVLDAGFVNGQYPYLAMVYFEQGSLAQRLAERGPLSVPEVLHVGIRIAGALESAHRAGILHRDVKPQNILMSRFNEPALADFGIATVLELEQSITGSLTPVHAAPELLEIGEPSPRTDVYALGSTLYTLLAGSPPFAGPPGEGVLAQLLRITNMELPALARTDVPPSLLATLKVATAKSAAERTPDAAALGRALQAVQAELGVERTTLPIEAQGPAATWAPPTAIVTPLAEQTQTAVTPATQSSTVAPAGVAAEPDAGSSEAGDDSHPTVGWLASGPAEPLVDTPTVTARQLAPPPEPAPRRRRWPLIVAAGLVAALAGSAVAFAITRRSTLEAGVQTTPAPDTRAPVAAAPSTELAATVAVAGPASTDPTSSVDPEAVRPTAVVSFDNAGELAVEWDDNFGGEHLVTVFPDDYTFPSTGVNVAATAAGRRFLLIPGLDARTPACFVVEALLEAPGGGAPARTAAGEPFCVNGAQLDCAASDGRPARSRGCQLVVATPPASTPTST